MAGFKGQFEYSVDNKGRVAIPAKLRAVLSPEARDTFVATRGIERCIYLYPLDYWEGEMEKRLRELNPYNHEARNYRRALLRWAEEVTLDKQGRIKLPKRLMEFAGIKDEAILIGSMELIEVWGPEYFNQYVNDEVYPFEVLNERVMGGTLR